MAGEAKERREVYSDAESFTLPGYSTISEHTALCLITLILLCEQCQHKHNVGTAAMLLSTPTPEQCTGYTGSIGWMEGEA